MQPIQYNVQSLLVPSFSIGIMASAGLVLPSVAQMSGCPWGSGRSDGMNRATGLCLVNLRISSLVSCRVNARLIIDAVSIDILESLRVLSLLPLESIDL